MAKQSIFRRAARRTKANINRLLDEGGHLRKMSARSRSPATSAGYLRQLRQRPVDPG